MHNDVRHRRMKFDSVQLLLTLAAAGSLVAVGSVSVKPIIPVSDSFATNSKVISDGPTTAVKDPQECNRFQCFPKCCPFGQVLTASVTCSESNTTITEVPFFDRLAEEVKVYRFGVPCKRGERYRLDASKDESHQFSIFPNGSLHEIVSKKQSNLSNYCIDLNESGNHIAIVCLAKIIENNELEYHTFTGRYSHHSFVGTRIRNFVNTFFFVLSAFVYAVLPQFRTLHGCLFIGYATSAAVAFFSQGILQLGEIPEELCKPIGFIVLFAFLASFFWLNIMCFDIWWVFSGYRSSRAVSAKELDRRKFIYYSLYSWGCSTVVFLIALIMESSWVPKSFIRPEFGIDRCWFHTKTATLLYFYLPVAAILICNLFFFIATTFKILRISMETKVLDHGENKRHDENDRQRFFLYFKLFIVMGINWLTELISFAYDDLTWLWYITDMSNTLQGVLIFIIFVWKRKTIRLLNEKFCPSINLLNATRGSTRSKVSPSKSSTNLTYKTSMTLSMSDNFKLQTIPSEMSISDAPS